MVVDRVSNSISVEPNNCQLMADDISGRQIFGIIGIIDLPAGPYLIVIENATKVGEINGQEICRMESNDLICFSKTTNLTEEQNNINTEYISMIKSVLNTPYFYFSYSWNLTNSLQRINFTKSDPTRVSLFQRVSAINHKIRSD